jgi:YD repeat-containing protein
LPTSEPHNNSVHFKKTNGQDNYLQATTGQGYFTEYKYDELNRQTKVIDADGDETKTEYFDLLSPANTPNAITIGLAELSLTNANVGKVVKTTDAKNHATYVLYDKYGRQIATYDAIKHQTSATNYDKVDRVTDSTDTFGQNTSYSYAPDNLHKTTTTPNTVRLRAESK